MLVERILIFCLIFSSTVYSQSIRINEISASNTIFFDEDGDTPDWIEIYNYGEQNISLLIGLFLILKMIIHHGNFLKFL